jgi:hypothetical protein
VLFAHAAHLECVGGSPAQRGMQGARRGGRRAEVGGHAIAALGG